MKFALLIAGFLFACFSWAWAEEKEDWSGYHNGTMIGIPKPVRNQEVLLGPMIIKNPDSESIQITSVSVSPFEIPSSLINYGPFYLLLGPKSRTEQIVAVLETSRSHVLTFEGKANGNQPDSVLMTIPANGERELWLKIMVAKNDLKIKSLRLKVDGFTTRTPKPQVSYTPQESVVNGTHSPRWSFQPEAGPTNAVARPWTDTIFQGVREAWELIMPTLVLGGIGLLGILFLVWMISNPGPGAEVMRGLGCFASIVGILILAIWLIPIALAMWLLGLMAGGVVLIIVVSQ